MFDVSSSDYIKYSDKKIAFFEAERRRHLATGNSDPVVKFLDCCISGEQTRKALCQMVDTAASHACDTSMLELIQKSLETIAALAIAARNNIREAEQDAKARRGE